MPAAADEVSASIAHLFSQHAADYQAMAAQAAAFNDQFVQQLTGGAFSYASIEAALALAVGVFVSSVFAVRPAFESPRRANEGRMTAQEIGRQFARLLKDRVDQRRASVRGRN